MFQLLESTDSSRQCVSTH